MSLGISIPSMGAAFQPLFARTPRQMAFLPIFHLISLLTLAGCGSPPAVQVPRVVAAAPDSEAPADEPPPAPREFRAAWVSTVANIDWPSRRDLGVAQQQAELIAIVERARELKLNALVLQVRPSADAIYPSALEPWSEFLVGEQGRPPQPFYDPLQMWIEEAHRRGLELHAWFNPYRAQHTAAKSALAANHIARTQPALVKSYGGFLWMDPGEPLAAQRTLDVIADVVRRYDIDGVQIDDYFYPYPVSSAPAGTAASALASYPDVDFPDGPAWQKFLAGGGALGRADWRRQNVNGLIERLNQAIHAQKPWLKFGISPFGLGRPDRRPPGIAGFSQYDKLYADVELWLARGWLDYLAPQLYWPIEPPAQSFPVLLDYWTRQNTRGRHLWPGLFTSRLDASAKSWPVEEVLQQIHLLRAQSDLQQTARGHLHFSMAALLENRRGIADRLKAADYAGDALVPATPWLTPPGGVTPLPPGLAVQVSAAGNPGLKLSMPAGAQPPRQFAIWLRYGRRWQFQAVPGAQLGLEVAARSGGDDLDDIVVSAIDRLGNESTRLHGRAPWTAGVAP
jgi:uncharacterized lipoprotein YddW (UPF0748 family)